MPNRFLWIFFDSYIKSPDDHAGVFSWGSCVAENRRHICCFSLPSWFTGLPACLPPSILSVLTQFFLLFPTLFYRTCVGAKDSIPDPFQSCYEKLPHSLTLLPISVKWQCKKALCNQGWNKHPLRIFDFPSDFLLYPQPSKISLTIVLHVWNFPRLVLK